MQTSIRTLPTDRRRDAAALHSVSRSLLTGSGQQDKSNELTEHSAPDKLGAVHLSPFPA